MAGTRSVLAEDIDCYNDKDLYNLPECVERRDLDRKSGNGQNESQGAPLFAPGPHEPGEQATGGGQQQDTGTGSPAQATGGGQPAGGGSPPPQQAAQSDDEDD